MATITKRGKGWRAQVRVKDSLGRKWYFSETFHSRQAAQEWARSREDAIRLGKANEGPRLTVEKALDKFETERREFKPLGASQRTYLGMWKKSYSDRDFATLTSDDIVQHIKRRAQQGAGPATLLQEVWALNGVFKMARTWGIRPEINIIEEALPTLRKLKLVGKSKQRDRRPTKDELDRLRIYLSANKRMPMADILDFAVASAMREGEIPLLKWSNLDKEKRLILIENRKDPEEKEGNNQWVPLLFEAFEIIKRQPRKDDRIFPYHPDSIGRCFREARDALGIQDLTFHDLRHEGTSRLFEAGYQIQEVAIVTGHKDWKSLKRYTQIRPESLHRDPVDDAALKVAIAKWLQAQAEGESSKPNAVREEAAA